MTESITNIIILKTFDIYYSQPCNQSVGGVHNLYTKYTNGTDIVCRTAACLSCERPSVGFLFFLTDPTTTRGCVQRIDSVFRHYDNSRLYICNK